MANKNGVVAILNIDRLAKKLTQLGSTDITPAIQWGTLKVQQTARQKVRKKTRTLERSIDELVSKQADGTVQGKVFTNVEYAPPLEFGVNKSYTVKPKDKKALKFTFNGVTVYAKKVVIPPRKPYPFMKPALDENKQVIRNAITSLYKGAIAKIKK